MATADSPAGGRPGRNDPCHCGSGNKYKRCCLEKDEAADRAALARAEAEAPAAPAEAAAPSPRRTPAPKHQTQQPWKRSAVNTHGLQRKSTPRKVGGS
jgi:hypothetical protein